MELNILHEVATLQRLTVGQLRQRFAELFGEATAASNRTWLIKRIAWRLQALAEGDLSARARRRAAALAQDADLRVTAPKSAQPTTAAAPTLRPMPRAADGRLPAPGTVLTRRYKGRSLKVRVLEQGFEYDGAVYASLSAVAKAITGSHCNGFLFFHLTRKEPNHA